MLTATLSTADLPPDDDALAPMDSAVGKWVFLGMLILMTTGVVGFLAFRPQIAPAPPEVLNDPVLLEGRAVFMARCITCHGIEGKGDGAIAASLPGPSVGDLSDGKWKYGERPEDVVRIIAKGVPDTRMAGWGDLLEDSQIRAVAAYCYYLSNLPVPESLRVSDDPSPVEPR